MSDRGTPGQIAHGRMLPSVNRRIFRAAMLVSLAGVLVKVIATGKEFAVAAVFGRSDAMDAFLIAYLVPGLMINLFAESMNQALIPTLVRVREQLGIERAQQLLSSAMTGTWWLLIAGSVAMAASARLVFPIMAAHFSPHKVLLTERLFYGLLPVVLLTGVASNCAAVINISGSFTMPALAPVATPFLVVLSLLLASPGWGIWILVYANVAGALVQAALMIGMMERGDLRYRLHWFGNDLLTRQALWELAGQYGPILLSGLLASAGLLVDQGMAAMLPPGSVSTLVYANRFVSVILNLLAGAIGTALTPFFAQMVAQEDWPGCRHTLSTYVRGTALVSLPIGVMMIFGSRLLVRLTFQHGRFGPADTAAVAPVQAMYAIQLPFFVVSRVYYRYLLAIRRTRLILYCGGINLVLDVVLNLVCMRWWGVAGIALATSLWSVSTFVFLGYWAYRLLPAQRVAAKAQGAV